MLPASHVERLGISRKCVDFPKFQTTFVNPMASPITTTVVLCSTSKAMMKILVNEVFLNTLVDKKSSESDISSSAVSAKQ